MEAARVFLADPPQNRGGIALRFFAEHRGKSGPGVFHVEVHVSTEHGLLHKQSAAKIRFALHGNAGLGFDVLREEFRKNDLLSEKL